MLRLSLSEVRVSCMGGLLDGACNHCSIFVLIYNTFLARLLGVLWHVDYIRPFGQDKSHYRGMKIFAMKSRFAGRDRTDSISSEAVG